MRSCHYWRKAGASSAPANILVFDCETYFGPNVAIAGGEVQRLRLGVALAYRLEKGRRTREKRLTFRTADEFWGFVLSRLDKRRPLWVFAHNISYDLGCVGGWSWISRSGFKVKKNAVTGQLFFIKGHFGQCGLILCDTINYFRCSLKSLGKSVGLPKMEMPEVDRPDDEWEVYCRNDVEVTALGVDKLIAFGREHSLGPWQPSIAGLAFAAFRGCFMRSKVLVHNYQYALKLERGAYYGGVVDTPVVSRKIPGPVYELDVCSMYPHACTLPLPIKYRGDGQRYGLQAVKRLAVDHMVFADVTLETQEDVYPIRLRRGTYYPHGRYRTYLAHPELLYAVERGHVRYVHGLSYYTHAPLFKSYMEFFIAKKCEYDSSGDEAFRTLCKYYGNNLYGKTGQMTPRWAEWCESTLELIEDQYGLRRGALEPWYVNPPDLYLPEETIKLPNVPIPLEVRDIYGTTEVKIGDHESRESCPAIAATVTSYARLLLRSYQRVAGPGHWFYSDTDSIWVDQQGRDALGSAGYIRPNTLGFLDQKSEHGWLVVHGPKDYETDKTIKRKGIRPNAEPQEDGGWKQLQFPSAITQIRDGIPDGVFVRHITKHLRRQVTKCRILSDGTTRPLVFPSECPD